ncbi:uncharacterized protein BCR38DRAFT_22248 [Pseudomassariella vexata]|uniref:Uncharacterized protein n=1 Tax=Pseudomassariella vexata TaxID=1141098 RepID=A0A1Y2EJX4_9PEZI|nr:uncharacterized protein BCR38DRAFT_22248 [Pseudomassariella vexata]ORY71863.1 hypothetical protein BCR38DRAFT_22248 [Pseudomassariella vexata]
MVRYHLVAAALVATVCSLPLNINLGAYSPALVVGDGEISFGGNQDVTSLMNALEGAAVSAAAGSGAAAEVAAPAVAAATPAAVSSPAPKADTSAAEEDQTTAADTTAADTSAADSSLTEQAADISTLQGMGKEIAPRDAADTEAPKAKRDLAGFDRALQYAEVALTKGPIIQLGTGEGGAGVGIIVDNRPTAAAEAVEAPAAAAKNKRDESEASQPRRRTKVTTMFIRRGIPAGMQTPTELERRDVDTLPIAALPKAKRVETSSEEKRTDTIDAINLNVEDPQGITMTFVETSDDEE